MTFHSILSDQSAGYTDEVGFEGYPFTVDLNLNQVIDAVTANKQEYNLKPFFYNPLDDVDSILYRQEVARDLENRPVADEVRRFSRTMVEVRRSWP